MICVPYHTHKQHTTHTEPELCFLFATQLVAAPLMSSTILQTAVYGVLLPGGTWQTMHKHDLMH